MFNKEEKSSAAPHKEINPPTIGGFGGLARVPNCVYYEFSKGKYLGGNFQESVKCYVQPPHTPHTPHTFYSPPDKQKRRRSYILCGTIYFLIYIVRVYILDSDSSLCWLSLL